ncbi:hypothetical protein BRARA_B02888 [Brassica rapa]|uniref:Uncharacterized protein n=1 Tax=Brassica campestris TaxID=3711 RepID=A0A398ADJ4_BRACM|nr:hypothetical protein BRARA_B02888 [Brassica rapa]
MQEVLGLLLQGVVASKISAQLLPWSYAGGYLDIFLHSLRNSYFSIFSLMMLLSYPM